MPSQRPLNAYPDYYGEIFRHVADTGEPFRIWVTHPNKARVIRVELYNYRNALRDEVRKGRADGVTEYTQKAAERVKMRVEDAPQPCVCLYLPEGLSVLREAYNESKQRA